LPRFLARCTPVRTSDVVGGHTGNSSEEHISTGDTVCGYSEYRMVLPYDSLIKWRSSQLAVAAGAIQDSEDARKVVIRRKTSTPTERR